MSQDALPPPLGSSDSRPDRPDDTGRNPPRGQTDNQELVDKHTVWARWRTILDAERTLGVWVSSGTSAILAGLAIVGLTEPRVQVFFRAMAGGLFVIIGGTLYSIGWWHYREAFKELRKVEPGMHMIPPLLIAAIVAILLGISMAVVAYLL